MPPTVTLPVNSHEQPPEFPKGSDGKGVGEGNQEVLSETGSTSTAQTETWTEFFEMLDRVGGVSEGFMESREQVFEDRHLLDNLFDEDGEEA
jgi:hypothetical protein